MSKAIIVKHLGKAKYRVKLQVDTERLDALRDALQLRIDYADQRIAGELQTTVSLTLSELSMAPEAKQPEKRFAYEAAVRALAYEKVRRQKAIDERARLAGQPSEIQRDIWCADYSTRLPVGTEVGVIDWLQVRGKKTTRHHVILPGYNFASECAYNVVRDGRTVPQLGLSTYTWWYNMMAAPCMERFDPHYRRAHITAIDVNGLADVLVEQGYTQVLGQSEAQPLSVQELVLHRVPVHYMCADAAVFQVGDWVVLEYPRKNLHADLVTAYEAQLDALERRKTQLDIELLTASSLQKPGLLMSLAQVKIAIGKITTRVEDERDRSELLAAYTRTRPTEVTIIGFVENPRPCRGIAFQKRGDPDWWVVSPLGAERKLSTAPALVGQFNWGVKNADGDYDCACVWTATEVRLAGYTYTLQQPQSGGVICAAGALRDVAGADQYIIYTIHAGSNSVGPISDGNEWDAHADDGFYLFKTTVGNGVIFKTATHKYDYRANGAQFFFINRRFGTYGWHIIPNGWNEIRTRVLISKDCKFAIVCHVYMPMKHHSDMASYRTEPENCMIWRLDLVSGSVAVINRYQYRNIDVISGPGPNSPPGASYHLAVGTWHIEHGNFFAELDTLFYNGDGDIATLAATETQLFPREADYTGGGYNYTFRELTFTQSAINRGDVRYIKKFRASDGVDKENVSQQLLHNVPYEHGSYPIYLECKLQSIHNGSTSITKLHTKNSSIQLLVMPNDDSVSATYNNVATLTTFPAELYNSAYIDGWSAGCVRVKAPYVDQEWQAMTPVLSHIAHDSNTGVSFPIYVWPDINEVYGGKEIGALWYEMKDRGNLWVEFRGDQCKTVRNPSFNYTILI